MIVALDDPDLRAAEALARQLEGAVAAFKIGLTLFSAVGPHALDRIGRFGNVFCDLKFHDIPHQVELASAEIARRGVWMFTIHASGGPSMVQAAVAGAARAEAPSPLIAAVTVLTALSAVELDQVGQGGEIQPQVARLAGMASQAGATAIVCSALHLKKVREIVGDKVVLVTPGIRGVKDGAGDQVQTASPAQACADGADFIVVGRPITEALDPASAAEEISQQF